MIIAAAINTEDENFFWHFGHCERFKIYEVSDDISDPSVPAEDRILSTSYIEVTGGHGPQRLQAMIDNGVNVVLSDGMGPGIAQVAPEFNIEIVAGVKGDADEAVKKYLRGELQNDPDGVHPCGQD